MEKKNKLRIIKISGIVIFNLLCLFSVIYVITMSMEKGQAVGQEAEPRVIKSFKRPASPQVQQAPQAETKQTPQPQQTKNVFLIDDFAGDEIRNRVGSRANVYTRAPSRAMISRRDDVVNGVNKKVLMIKYDKKNTGGPDGMGGWCGYYTLIKNEKTGEYLDGTGYKYVTFWVRGEKGEENFMVGVADEHWDKIGDSLKAEEIGVYLEKGKITTQWQKAKVPLEVFFLDHEKLSAISINFEADCFPEGAGAGVVYIADIALEK